MNENLNTETYAPTAPKAATKKEFLKLPENTKMRREINGAAIICYVCAGITLLVALGSGSLASILDVLILVGLGLGIHLAQSKACAILLTIYASISVLITLIAYGRLAGWLPLVAGIAALVYTVKLSKAWKAYNAN